MAKTTKKKTTKKKRKAKIGHDPFADLDAAQLDEKPAAKPSRAAATAAQKPRPEKIGHDPFTDLDTTWLGEKPAAKPPPVAAPTVPTGRPAPGARPAPPLTATVPTRPHKPEATFHFPDDFKWGVATSAYQNEGNTTNSDWWAWEQEEGHIKEAHKSERACDWWENAEADFDRAGEMHLNALRLSVEWSRVEPQPGEFDDAALARYAEMVQGLQERGIEPLVTLHHFSNPQWLADQGGWETPEVVDRFARFTRRVVETLDRHCSLWCTINEPNVYSYMGYLEGSYPPGRVDAQMAARVTRHLLQAHAAAYREIHAVQPQARVGFAHNMRIFDPANPRSPLDRRAAREADTVHNQAILTALTKGRWPLTLGLGLAWNLRRTLDWIGLNYYTRDLIAFDRTQRPLPVRRTHAQDAEWLDGGYGEFYPRGIFRCLKRLKRLNLPIYVTENGLPDEDDDQRPRYLLTHLHQMWQAIQFCYPVMGYYHWTLVDNFEWDEGWTLRFGLIARGPRGARRPRRSAALYADIVRANAITPQIIETYAPELRPELLPA